MIFFLSLVSRRQMQAQFADERNWNQFHSPRNLLLALVSYNSLILETVMLMHFNQHTKYIYK